MTCPPSSHDLATRLARVGIDQDPAHGAVMPPLHLSANYSFDGLEGKRHYDYSRSGNPTRDLLGEALTALEGGAGTVVTASGMAAVDLVLSELSPGDLVIAPHDGYGGTHRKCRVTIHTARPGVIIGKKGADIEGLRKKIAAMTASELHLNIVEVRKPELDAALVAESIAQQLERRVSFRRAMKRSVQNAMRMGALGIKVNVAGRLGGAEIARTEWYREGRVPLHTLRADIDYAHAEASTAYGIIGIKTWIFKGEIMEHDPQAHDRRAEEAQAGPAPRGDRGRR